MPGVPGRSASRRLGRDVRAARQGVNGMNGPSIGMAIGVRESPERAKGSTPETGTRRVPVGTGDGISGTQDRPAEEPHPVRDSFYRAPPARRAGGRRRAHRGRRGDRPAGRAG